MCSIKWYAVVIMLMAGNCSVHAAKKAAPRHPNADNAIQLLETTSSERIGFVLYTLHERTLKMTAQFYPLAKGESRTTSLEKKVGNKWVKVDEAVISEEPYKSEKNDAFSWTALFRVENWDDTVASRYRVVAIDGKSTKEILYTLRIKGTEFTPKVFSKGTFTVRVGELGTAREKKFKKVAALNTAGAKTINVNLVELFEGE